MAQPRGKCVFCGSIKDLTKEHIWSDWLKQIISRDWHRNEAYVANVLSPDESTDQSGQKTRQGAVHTKKIRKVCKTCNSGWMSDIVEAAKPTAKSLILGEQISLTRKFQAKLGTWLALSAMMADRATKSDKKLPDSDLQFMFENHKTPPHWHIGIGFYSGKESVAFNNSVWSLLTEDASGRRFPHATSHTKASILKHLYSIVDVVVPKDFSKISPATMYLPYLAPIFPVMLNKIGWPPPNFVTITGTMNTGDGLAAQLATRKNDRLSDYFIKEGIITG
jgi:hypothetical protein